MATNQEKKIKETLAKLRATTGMTQTALAKKMGTTQEYVCRMERKGAVTTEKFAQFVKACGGSMKLVVKWHNAEGGKEISVIRFVENKDEDKA